MIKKLNARSQGNSILKKSMQICSPFFFLVFTAVVVILVCLSFATISFDFTASVRFALFIWFSITSSLRLQCINALALRICTLFKNTSICTRQNCFESRSLTPTCYSVWYECSPRHYTLHLIFATARSINDTHRARGYYEPRPVANHLSERWRKKNRVVT